MDSMTPPCPDNWESCLHCGALPEQECLDPDAKGREAMSYKGMYAHETLGDNPSVSPEEGTRVSPEHYSRYAIEPIDFISLNNIGFEAGNVIKYVTRYDAKNGLEDLQKARRYLDFLIAKEQGQRPSEVE